MMLLGIYSILQQVFVAYCMLIHWLLVHQRMINDQIMLSLFVILCHCTSIVLIITANILTCINS